MVLPKIDAIKFIHQVHNLTKYHYYLLYNMYRNHVHITHSILCTVPYVQISCTTQYTLFIMNKSHVQHMQCTLYSMYRSYVQHSTHALYSMCRSHVQHSIHCTVCIDLMYNTVHTVQYVQIPPSHSPVRSRSRNGTRHCI